MKDPQPKPGRRTLYNERMQRYPVTMPPEMADLATRIGGGNLSAGVRKALEEMGKRGD